ncbi:hypothetical protein [Brevundimonas sp.]|uniref:hypothetical protein n=1 Tax=Brevundimonas sp. TaxID=1871086 RepID=UPI00391A6160
MRLACPPPSQTRWLLFRDQFQGEFYVRKLAKTASQGFWNGALPPIGYRIVAVEQRGSRIKKKLEIDPLQAQTVRTIYRWRSPATGTRPDGPEDHRHAPQARDCTSGYRRDHLRA